MEERIPRLVSREIEEGPVDVKEERGALDFQPVLEFIRAGARHRPSMRTAHPPSNARRTSTVPPERLKNSLHATKKAVQM